MRIVGAIVALALAALVTYETLDASGDSAGWQVAGTVFAAWPSKRRTRVRPTPPAPPIGDDEPTREPARTAVPV